MKVCLPSDSNMDIGGGWTFKRNLIEAAKRTGLFEVVSRGADWDIALVSGATMITRDTWQALKQKGKVVLRVDGVPEAWRNRGTGWSRLRDYAKKADRIIYQSKFVQRTVGGLLGRGGFVIYNGTDKSIFKPHGLRLPKFGSPSLLNVYFRKDPNKRIEEVIMRFREFKVHNVGATLTLVGRYPTYLRQWKFGMLDLKEGKDWRYMGIAEHRDGLAKMMRSCDYFAYPSFADPMPNVLIEAMSCGLKPLWINDYGGAKEIVDNWHKVDWGLERMGEEYINAFEKIL